MGIDASANGSTGDLAKQCRVAIGKESEVKGIVVFAGLCKGKGSIDTVEDTS